MSAIREAQSIGTFFPETTPNPEQKLFPKQFEKRPWAVVPYELQSAKPHFSGLREAIEYLLSLQREGILTIDNVADFHEKKDRKNRVLDKHFFPFAEQVRGQANIEVNKLIQLTPEFQELAGIFNEMILRLTPHEEGSVPDRKQEQESLNRAHETVLRTWTNAHIFPTVFDDPAARRKISRLAHVEMLQDSIKRRRVVVTDLKAELPFYQERVERVISRLFIRLITLYHDQGRLKAFFKPVRSSQGDRAIELSRDQIQKLEFTIGGVGSNAFDIFLPQGIQPQLDISRDRGYLFFKDPVTVPTGSQMLVSFANFAQLGLLLRDSAQGSQEIISNKPQLDYLVALQDLFDVPHQLLSMVKYGEIHNFIENVRVFESNFTTMLRDMPSWSHQYHKHRYFNLKHILEWYLYQNGWTAIEEHDRRADQMKLPSLLSVMPNNAFLSPEALASMRVVSLEADTSRHVSNTSQEEYQAKSKIPLLQMEKLTPKDIPKPRYLDTATKAEVPITIMKLQPADAVLTVRSVSPLQASSRSFVSLLMDDQYLLDSITVLSEGSDQPLMMGKDFIVMTNNNQTLYGLQLFGRPYGQVHVEMKWGLRESAFQQPKLAELPADLQHLNTEALSKVVADLSQNSVLRQKCKVLAENKDQVSILDFVDCVKTSARYSFDENSEKDLEDELRQMDGFLNESDGMYHFQCDGAAKLVRVLLNRYFEKAGLPYRVKTKSTYVAERNIITLAQAHAYNEVESLEGELILKIDATPFSLTQINFPRFDEVRVNRGDFVSPRLNRTDEDRESTRKNLDLDRTEQVKNLSALKEWGQQVIREAKELLEPHPYWKVYDPGDRTDPVRNLMRIARLAEQGNLNLRETMADLDLLQHKVSMYAKAALRNPGMAKKFPLYSDSQVLSWVIQKIAEFCDKVR